MTARQRAAETKRRRTRRMIVLATLDLYDEADDGDFTREQIAEAADVSVATLYNHFTYKYDILQAAHEQLLAPVIQPIVRGMEDGTYNPSDPVEELLRCMYAVNKLSHEHQALTMAMIKAYFEVPRNDRYIVGKGDRQIGSHITEGMTWIVHQREPFRHVGNYISDDRDVVYGYTVGYHVRSMLLEFRDAYYHHADERPLGVTKTTAAEMLPAILAGFDPFAIEQALDRVEAVQQKVDEWYEKLKQRDDLAGW